MSFGVCLRRSRAGRREKIHCLVSQNYHSLVSNKLQRAEGYEEVGMILRGCACNKTTHNTILYLNAHTNTQEHQRVHYWCIWDIHLHLLQRPSYSWYTLELWQPQTTQSTYDVQCSAFNLSVSWGLEDVHVRSGWLIHLAQLQYSHGPLSCTPFPPAMYFPFTLIWLSATHMEIWQKYQVCIKHVN